jgi:hypothetical protein
VEGSALSYDAENHLAAMTKLDVSPYMLVENRTTVKDEKRNHVINPRRGVYEGNH